MGEGTRQSLLIRVRDPRDAEAWEQFAQVYAPLIYRFARKRGLQDADAADLSQIALTALMETLREGGYDRNRGTFRGWLFGLVRHQMQKYCDRNGRQPAGTGGTSMRHRLEEQPAPEADEITVWDGEFERQMFLAATERVRGEFHDSSWQAFWQTAVAGRGAGDVGRELGLSVGAVYTAKSRVLSRVKQEIELMQEV
jgi:RNA polymerase sigma-70 factor (ECF subfamily)